MKSIFSDLDAIIEQAVKGATSSEKHMQKEQEKSVKRRGLDAEKAKKEAEEAAAKEKAEEAADDEPAKDDEKSAQGGDDESAEKMKGEPEEKAPSAGGKDVPGTKTSKKLLDPKPSVIANPQFNDIKDKVNALRGSGSLRDEKVSSGVKQYLGSLSTAEKGALLTYLTNLAQIMATVRTPKQVKRPGSVGINVTFSKKPPKEKSSKSEKSGKSGKDAGNDVVVVGEK